MQSGLVEFLTSVGTAFLYIMSSKLHVWCDLHRSSVTFVDPVQYRWI